MNRNHWLVVVLAVLFMAPPLEAQRLDRELRVFFDCPDTDCDDDYLTEQIGWVAFVRDRTVADVHGLVTAEIKGELAYFVDCVRAD